MNRYLRSDVTRLSEKDIQDIISAKNSMKRASEVMANKYKISSRRVYQIWRGVHLPIDPKEMVSYPPTDPPSDSKKMVSTNADLSHGKKTDTHKSSSIIIPENKGKKTGGGIQKPSRFISLNRLTLSSWDPFRLSQPWETQPKALRVKDYMGKN